MLFRSHRGDMADCKVETCDRARALLRERGVEVNDAERDLLAVARHLQDRLAAAERVASHLALAVDVHFSSHSLDCGCVDNIRAEAKVILEER